MHRYMSRRAHGTATSALECPCCVIIPLVAHHKMAARRPQLYGGYGNPDHLKVLITLHAAQVDGKKYELHYGELA